MLAVFQESLETEENVSSISGIARKLETDEENVAM